MQPLNSDEYIHKSELDQLKLDILLKINRTFDEEDEKDKKRLMASKDQHVITPSYSPKMETFEMTHDSNMEDPLDKIAAADFKATHN